ncbi:MAG: hypothetical protein ACTSQQ_14285, partial [Candidatus Helarchaeota archaeon]
MEPNRFRQEIKQEIPRLPSCITYLAIVILITIFLFFISEYFWLRVYTTEGASALLNLFGVDSSVYFNQSFDIVQICAGDCFYVIKICSGIEAIALVSGLIIATPTSWQRKIGGTLFIAFGIFGANILRILTTIL